MFSPYDAATAISNVFTNHAESAILSGKLKKATDNLAWITFYGAIAADLYVEIDSLDSSLLFRSDVENILDRVLRGGVDQAIEAFNQFEPRAEGNEAIARIGKYLRGDGGESYIRDIKPHFMGLFDREIDGLFR